MNTIAQSYKLQVAAKAGKPTKFDYDYWLTRTVWLWAENGTA